MELLILGIIWGLGLAILVGPLIIALLQASLEYGTKAGFWLASGIWVSDASFILVVYFGLKEVMTIANWAGFKPLLGILGAIVLFAVGASALWSKPPDFNLEQVKTKERVAFSPWTMWLKGFLINTLNPFTIFFWITITTTILVGDEVTGWGALSFYGGLLGTIICTDSLKVFLAKLIRNKIKPGHIQYIRKISGIAFILFGFGLLIRVFVLN